MSGDLFEKIIASTYTVGDLKRKSLLVKTFLEGLFFDANDAYVDLLDTQDKLWLEALFETKLEKPTIETLTLPNNISKTNITALFERFEEKIKTINPLTVMLANPIPDTQIEALTTSLRKKNGSEFFLDIKYDPSLIGGCALVYNGIYKDYSLKKTLEENKEKIREIALKYIQATSH